MIFGLLSHIFISFHLFGHVITYILELVYLFNDLIVAEFVEFILTSLDFNFFHISI